MAASGRRRSFIAAGVVALLVALIAGGYFGVTTRYPRGEILRYLDRRLSDHPRLASAVAPFVDVLRPAAPTSAETVGAAPSATGQQAFALAAQPYAADRPVALAAPLAASAGLPAATQLAGDWPSLLAAIRAALPGEVIELAPGTYAMEQTLPIDRPGEPGLPIVLRVAVPGTAVIESRALEGFLVRAPYWLFENLVVRGRCAEHAACEHAFHIVGRAAGTVIRNSRLEDFNAQVKVNGEGGNFPDRGLLQFNTLLNRAPRATTTPVTPVDIVAANEWTVADNRVDGFTKVGGKGISYGMFMKGAGRGGRFLRNEVACGIAGSPGVRVGISFGGGGTDAPFCRDRRCEVEHAEGEIAGNRVFDCNDFGIDIHRSAGTRVTGNWLANTWGVDVRGQGASATVEDNRLDGIVRARDGGIVEARRNRSVRD